MFCGGCAIPVAQGDAEQTGRTDRNSTRVPHGAWPTKACTVGLHLLFIPEWPALMLMAGLGGNQIIWIMVMALSVGSRKAIILIMKAVCCRPE